MSFKFNGKIGLCNNSDLPDLQSNEGMHYVYIRKTKNRNKVDVHTLTTIENVIKDDKHSIPIVINKHGDIRYIDPKKIRAIRNGNLYPIPFYQSNLTKWVGITRKPIKNVDKNKIIITNKKIWKRHKFIVGKTYR